MNMVSPMTIWKFPLEIKDRQEIRMPIGARILSVQLQNETMTLWAWVNPDAYHETRAFVIVGTGNEMWDRVKTYIGTVQTHHGALVWHVFEGITAGDL